MEWIIILLIYVVFIYGIFKLAKSKNRNPSGWILASILISPLIVIIVLAVMQKLPGKKTKQKKKKIIKRK